jgi:hypothetical protein
MPFDWLPTVIAGRCECLPLAAFECLLSLFSMSDSPIVLSLSGFDVAQRLRAGEAA